MAVWIDPHFLPDYYAFYLEGIRRVFGEKAIHFSSQKLPAFHKHDGFTLEIDADVPYKRLYISANDFARIDHDALAWCDRYGIVNYAAEFSGVPAYQKVAPIGPSFGIQSWGQRNLLSYILLWDLSRKCRSPQSFKRFLQLYRNQLLNRLPERQYTPKPSRADYVFFVATPWKKHVEVNPPRARFIRACRKVSTIQFEGGFAPRHRDDVSGMEDLAASRHYPFREYLDKIQRSSVVFNCPAVHDCLGWKLGEFFALGKAIISIPLAREMPSPLVHGEHVHFIDDSEEAMQDAVALLSTNHAYRRYLEENARKYYLSYLAPERVIRRLCGIEG